MNRPKTCLRLILGVSLIVTSAQASTECWRLERFSSPEAFDSQRMSWRREETPLPAPWDIFAAYQLYKAEQGDVRRSFRNDKQMHCYMGCRMAQDINFQTAQWAGWKKEEIDLNDCRPESHFETLDYQVTVIGAHYGATSKTKEECKSRCVEKF